MKSVRLAEMSSNCVDDRDLCSIVMNKDQSLASGEIVGKISVSEYVSKIVMNNKRHSRLLNMEGTYVQKYRAYRQRVAEILIPTALVFHPTTVVLYLKLCQENDLLIVSWSSSTCLVVSKKMFQILR